VSAMPCHERLAPVCVLGLEGNLAPTSLRCLQGQCSGPGVE
jgi:hypothetical protein